MNYLYAKRRNTRRPIWIIGILVILVFAALLYFGVLARLGAVLGSIVRPAWKAKDSMLTAADPLSGALQSKSSLVAENTKLKNELEDLRIKMTNYQTLVDENNSLKELFDRKPADPGILAGILVKPAQTLYDTLVIDAGTREGIRVGARVFAGGTVLLGEISEVGPVSSKVLMYSSSGHTTEVVITGKNISTEAVGRGGGTFEMTFPRDTEFPIGTEIVTPGIVPYLVGLVDEVISDPRDPLQKVLLRSPVNVQEIKFVEVEK